MKKPHRYFVIDLVSTIGANITLYSINAPWWAYTLIWTFGIAQKWDGREQVKEESKRETT